MALKIMNGLDLQSQQISNVGDPSTAQQAATKNYVDNVAQGIYWKQSARVASTGNVTVSGPGTTIDGVTLNNGDRILLKSQTAGAENGLWQFNGSAAALTRTTDGDDGTELNAGAAVFVTEGTANKDTAWIQTTTGTITIGTTATVWTQFGGGPTYSAGNGITIASNTISAQLGSGLTFSGTQIVTDHTIVPKKYAATLTTSATSYTVNHALGTQDVTVAVYAAATPFNVVLPDIAYTDANNVTLTFATAPAANAYRVVVIG